MHQARLLFALPLLGSTSSEDGSRTKTWLKKMRWTKRPGLRLHLLHQRLQRIQRLLPHDPERQWWAAVVPKAAVVAVRPAEDAVVVTAVLRQTERQDHLPALLSRCMSDKSAEHLQRRFSKALQGVDIINTLCAQPLLLREWSF